MAYVSGKDGAHTQELGTKFEPLNSMPNLKLSFLLGVRLIYINPDREIKTPAFHWSIFAALQQSCLQLRINCFAGPKIVRSHFDLPPRSHCAQQSS